MKALYIILGISIAIVLFILASLFFFQSQTMKITSFPEGATVRLDGKPIEGKTPLSVSKPKTSETVVVEVSLEGYTSQSKEVELTTDDTQEISFSLLRIGTTPTPTIPPPYRVNPTFTEKIKREPFWTMLPYFGDTFKVEYKDSDDKIIITTLNGTAEQVRSYQTAAVNWLKTNGGPINRLTIEYKIVP